MQLKFYFIYCITAILYLTSCNPEYHSVGSSFFSTETFYSEIYRAPVFVFQDQVKSVQSDGLPSVQLGKINHSFFGESSASITAQLAISNNPIFGNYSQEQEDLADGTEPSIIQENERVTSVFFEVPFYNNQNDFDQDGVIDYLDIDPKDPDSDSDSDGLSDFSENAVGTNPLSNDSDNDGILDNEDTDSSSYDPENKVYEIDSVYGNKDSKFNIKIHELTYYLNLLDPYTARGEKLGERSAKSVDFLYHAQTFPAKLQLWGGIINHSGGLPGQARPGTRDVPRWATSQPF